MKLIPNNKNVCKECTTPNICRDKGAFNSCRLVTKKDIDKIHKSPILKRIKPTIPMSSELKMGLRQFFQIGGVVDTSEDTTSHPPVFKQ